MDAASKEVTVSQDVMCPTSPVGNQDVTVQCAVTQGVAEIQAANLALKRQLQWMTRQQQVLTKEAKRLHSKRHINKLVHKTIEEQYSPAQVNHILKPNDSFVWNYSKDDITAVLVLKAISTKAFNFIRSRKPVVIPCRTRLAQNIKDFSCAPGI